MTFRGRVGAEHRRASEHARIKELEQTPEVVYAILDWRSRQSQTMLRFKQPRRLRGLRGRILDGLSFVEDDCVEWDVLQQQDIAAQRAVRRQNNVVIVNLAPPVLPFASGVIED